MITNIKNLLKLPTNYPFLIYLDSIGMIMLNIVLKYDLGSLLSNLNSISNINKNSAIFNLNLRLLSKDFYRFKITYLITELLNKKENKNKEILDQYINSLLKERQFIKENKFEEAFQEFKTQYTLLFQNFKEINGFEKLMISLIVSKYKEVNDDGFRSKLCLLVKDNEILIKYSTELFVIIFKRYNIDPYCLEENTEVPNNPFSSKLREDPILKAIDGGKEGIPKELKEILKTVFKFNITKYFEDEIERTETIDIKDKIIVLLGENSFSDFKNAYENLKNLTFKKKDDIYNANIKEQYCITYCNLYLENFVKYCFEEKEYTSGIRNDLLQFLNDEETQTTLKNTLKIVILKLIKTNYIKDQSEFMNNKDIWGSDYSLESLIKNYDFKAKENLLHLFYNGKDEDEFKRILDEKIQLRKMEEISKT